MEAVEAIMTRRSIAQMAGHRPERASVVKLLQAAVRAPNHHLTQPWRFIVLTGRGLDALGEAMAERIRRESVGDPDLARKVEAERARPHRAPVIVTVVYVPSEHPRAVEAEDRYAVGAAIQNVLLAAHAEGLATYLRTGPAAQDPAVRSLLGLTEGEEIAGFVYLGYPSTAPGPLTQREPAEERVRWIGWD
ncbi:MAG: nitroreductase family protein [Actinomycetota bacterium]